MGPFEEGGFAFGLPHLLPAVLDRAAGKAARCFVATWAWRESWCVPAPSKWYAEHAYSMNMQDAVCKLTVSHSLETEAS